MAPISINTEFWNSNVSDDFFKSYETFKTVIGKFFVDKEVAFKNNEVTLLTPPLTTIQRYNIHKYQRVGLFYIYTNRSKDSNKDEAHPMQILITNFDKFYKDNVPPAIPEPVQPAIQEPAQPTQVRTQPNFDARIADILNKLIIVVTEVNTLAADMRNHRNN
jgi:hypothetical protein